MGNKPVAVVCIDVNQLLPPGFFLVQTFLREPQSPR